MSVWRFSLVESSKMFGRERRVRLDRNLRDWVQRLNRVSSDYVATEWEVVLLRALRNSEKSHEPRLGRRSLLFVFSII